MYDIEKTRERGINDAIKSSKRRLKALEDEGRGNGYVARELRKLLPALEKEAPLVRENVKALEQSTHFKTLEVKASQNLKEELEKLAKATKESISASDAAVIEANTKAIERYGRAANAASLLAASNIGAEIAATESRIEAYQKELDAITSNARTQAKISEEEKARQKELTNLIAQETQKQAELGIQARNAVIDAFEQGLNDANQKVDTLAGAASKLKSSFEGVTAGLQSGLQAALGLIDAVVNTEIQGLEVGSKKRKEIIRAQLRAQATANEVETNIAKFRLDVQNKIAQNEARVAQLRLQAEAKLASARGETDLAKALREAANVQDTVIQGLRAQSEIEKEVLDIQKATADQKLINKGLSEELGDTAGNVASQIGVQNINLDAAKRKYDSLMSKADGLSKKFGEIASQSSEAAKSTQENAINEAANDARNLSNALGEAGNFVNEIFNAAQNAEQPFNNIESTTGRISQYLNDARREADGLLQIINSGGVGGPARAMGGPVAAGRQYTVNDGGGREAFLSRSGALSLLPAARNIQWTAPSSGTIIPANIVKAMQKNGDINSSISSKQSIKEPDISMIASSAASGVSGNLAKQLSSAMTGSTSNRIVNNVTIQSQNPVHEASDLMTNVARMRIRNRRGL